MSYNLFLDDVRRPKDVHWAELPENVTWEIVRNYHEFRKKIAEKGIPKFVAYDCDLHPEHNGFYGQWGGDQYLLHFRDFQFKCGIECVELLIEECKKQRVPHPPFVAHTLNFAGRHYITNLINKFNNEAVKPDWADRLIIKPDEN
jgi:hypothetical protein